ncbi:MAG: hypothetical protein K6B71_03005 [Alphaproteobacteria bacterium]|nr:hypothetical protein [Alphaproteobacteria bacterium]
MKKIVLIFMLLTPIISLADRRSDFIEAVLDYEKTNVNQARINAYAVNQEKLDMYRATHPRYNFPEHIKDLNEPQAKQILSYFWDNYRFGDYKYDEIQEKVWDMMIHMSMSDLEKQINECIRKYYKFDNSFYAPFGSIASVDLLNGMKPKNVPDFYLILDKIKY